MRAFISVCALLGGVIARAIRSWVPRSLGAIIVFPIATMAATLGWCWRGAFRHERPGKWGAAGFAAALGGMFMRTIPPPDGCCLGFEKTE